MRPAEAQDGSCVGAHLRGCAEPLEVDLECGPIIEGVHAPALAARDRCRLADRAPPVAHADAEGRLGGQYRGYQSVRPYLAVHELVDGRGRGPVARMSADERDGGAEGAAGRVDRLLVVSGEHEGFPVGEL